MQSIQYFAPNYLGFHIPYLQLRKNTFCTCKVFNTLHLYTWGSIYPTSKNTSCMCKVFNTLHLNTWGLIYIQLRKNTSCTCKVFNTLHLNTWWSIYLTSKKYFLLVQSIQYFAPNYLGFHISNFEKILFARAKYSILCTYIPGHLGVHISNFEKYFLHVLSIQYFAPKYLVVNISNFLKILLACAK